MTNSSNTQSHRTITVTNNERSRIVLYPSDVQHSLTGRTKRRCHLQQTSQTTTFLRQLELFCDKSLTDRSISNDRKIQSIARGIATLDGVSCNFDEMVVQEFHKDGRELLLESIDFDKGHLCVVEIENPQSRPLNSLHHSGRRRTIEELWELVVQDTAASAPTVDSMMDDINNNNGFESDYRNEEMLKYMRKIIHRLEEIEERLQDLLNHSNEDGSARTPKVLLKYTKDLIYMHKKLNEFFADKGKKLFGADYKALDELQVLLYSEDKEKFMDALERLMSICKTSDMDKLRKWLRRKIPLTPVVLLIDNSNSMVKGRITTLSFCKQFIETLKESPKTTAVAVVTIGDGPECVIPFTLAQDFNVNDLDKIQHIGCTPLTASVKFARKTLLNYIGDDENREAMSGYIVIVSDLTPTEEWNGGFSENYSNPKDENQESREKIQKLHAELKDTMKNELKNIPVVVALPENRQQETANYLLGASEGYVLDISSAISFPILANYNLHQMYKFFKGSGIIAEQHQFTNKLLKVTEYKKLAERFEVLDTEWVIEMEPERKIIGLPMTNNDEINRRAIRQEFQKKSTVVDLLIEGKERKCRIVSNDRNRSSNSLSGSIEEERKFIDESYPIRITRNDGEIEPQQLVKKQESKKKTKETDKNS